MRLISCHIENFGKLHDCSREFHDGVNVVREENGWGKSTFAAFVRAMFYGLGGERKRSLLENERKRYKPWQGGIFGGQLVFEIHGKKYKVSRIFKDKEANDEFELRDAETNLLSDAYGKKIGEEIFKINREAFMRTVFIGQGECETAATDDVNAKIGNFADNANDLDRYEAANARLTEIVNALTPSRATGSIAKRREEIARYGRIVQGGEGILESIDKYQGYFRAEEELLESLKIQMKAAGEQQARASGRQAALAKRSEWERLKKEAGEKRREREERRKRFPKEVPAMEEIRRKIVECGEMEKVYERMQIHQLSEAEAAELAALQTTFCEGGSADAGRIGQLGEEGGLEALRDCFAKEQRCASVIMKKWGERNSRNKALPSNKAALAALKASMAASKAADNLPETGKGKMPLLGIVGIALAIIGVIMAVAVHLQAGICAVVVGAGLLAAGMIAGRNGAKPADTGNGAKPADTGNGAKPAGTGNGEKPAGTGNGAKPAGDGKDVKPRGGEDGIETPDAQADLELENLRGTIEEDEAFIAKVDGEVADYLMGHGKVFDEETASDGLQGILEDLYAYENKAEKYFALKEKQENFEKAMMEFKTVGGAVATFLDKCGYEPSQRPSRQLEEIRELAQHCQVAEDALREANARLGRFEAENDVAGLAKMQGDGPLPSLGELNQQIQTLNGEMEKAHRSINEYHNTLEDLQRQYDEWEECVARLEELKERQAEEQKKFDYVFKARLKLELAKEAMTAKYADPILKGFGKYYEMISGDTADRFHIDANTAVTVDELGRQRDSVSLSSGYRDLVGICLRMALVDAMYKGEAPFLVMDDPFANLDDKKVAAARRFVEELGKTYQVVYFTCSHSRG